jgi:glycosyltransferase involved in cell wall biosynthesis
MHTNNKIAVIIPALNEEESIAHVISAIPQWVDDIVVADNGSTDGTASVAHVQGARVVTELRRGYGSACLTAINALHEPDILVFIDGDFSDYPEEMPYLVDPIIRGEAEIVIGSRVLGKRQKGSLTPQQIMGNALACFLIRLFWKKKYTDLGPFRAIRFSSLKKLGMKDPDYGWTVEMQIKAVRAGLSIKEVPVSYRQRIGTSKVSGTIRGIAGAGSKIFFTIFKYALMP